MAGIENGVNKGKPHVIDRPGQEAEVDEMLEQLYKRLGRLSILTTKGDIITYDGTNYVRLGRGSEGQVLTSRDSAVYGIQWETPAPGGGSSNGALRFWLNGQPWGVI